MHSPAASTCRPADQRDRAWEADDSADTDLRLARYLGMSEGFFLGLQADYDLMERRRQIEAILPPSSRGQHSFDLLPAAQSLN